MPVVDARRTMQSWLKTSEANADYERARSYSKSVRMYNVRSSETVGCIGLFTDEVHAISLLEKIDEERFVVWNVECDDLTSGSLLLKAFAECSNIVAGQVLENRWKVAISYYRKDQALLSPMPSSLDAIMQSVSLNPKQALRQKMVETKCTSNVVDAVRMAIGTCQKKNVRCIIPIGLESWGMSEFREKLVERVGARMKIVSRPTECDDDDDHSDYICKTAYLQYMYNAHDICFISDDMFTTDEIDGYTKFPFQIVMFVPRSLQRAILLSKDDYDIQYITEKFNSLQDPSLLTNDLHCSKLIW